MTRPAPRARSTRIREIVGFGGVGVIAFTLQVGLFNLCVHAGIGPLSSNALSVIASVAWAYVGNRYVAFGHRRSARPAREAAGFLAVNLATFLVGELVLSLAYLVRAEHDKVVVNVLNVAGIAVGSVLRFWAYRRWIFAGDGSPARPATRASAATHTADKTLVTASRAES